MKHIKLLLSLLIVFLLLGCGHNKKNILSPDGNLLLKTYVKDHFVYLEIYSAKGKRLFNTNTEISSVHRWSVKWYDNTTVLLKSSDVGDFFWKKTGASSWEKVGASSCFSPDKKMIVIVEWGFGKGKQAKLVIGNPSSTYAVDSCIGVLHTIRTGIQVSDLVGCVEWVKPDLIRLKGDKGMFYFEMQKDGNWH